MRLLKNGVSLYENPRPRWIFESPSIAYCITFLLLVQLQRFLPNLWYYCIEENQEVTDGTPTKKPDGIPTLVLWVPRCHKAWDTLTDVGQSPFSQSVEKKNTYTHLPQHEGQVKQKYIGANPSVQLCLHRCRNALSSVSEKEEVV